MSGVASSTARSWFFFVLSCVAVVVVLMYKPEYFWMTLPFVFTFFLKAINIL